MIHIADNSKMKKDLNWLRRTARRVAELGNAMKSETETIKETNELVTQSLIDIIKRYLQYDWDWTLSTPELLYDFVRCLLYFHVVLQTGETDVADEVDIVLHKELVKIYDRIKCEYDYRLYNLNTNKQSQP